MNAKQILLALNERFPIRPETTLHNFSGAHSITLDPNGQVQINVWAMTPVGVRIFYTTVPDGLEDADQDKFVAAIAEAISICNRSAVPQSASIMLNGRYVTLNSLNLTYEQIVKLAYPDDANGHCSVTYRDETRSGILFPGQRIGAVNGMTINCYDTSNA